MSVWCRILSMTQFKIGQTVQRVESAYTHAPTFIKNEFTLKYVQDLADLGYKYLVVKEAEDDTSFDLPEIKDGLRIHRKPFEECESCSS